MKIFELAYLAAVPKQMFFPPCPVFASGFLFFFDEKENPGVFKKSVKLVIKTGLFEAGHFRG